MLWAGAKTVVRFLAVGLRLRMPPASRMPDSKRWMARIVVAGVVKNEQSSMIAAMSSTAGVCVPSMNSRIPFIAATCSRQNAGEDPTWPCSFPPRPRS